MGQSGATQGHAEREDRVKGLAATDLHEFYVEHIIGHSGTGKYPKKVKFRMHWLRYDPEDDTMLDWSAVKDLAATITVRRIQSHLNLG